MRSAWLSVLLLTACASGAGSTADPSVPPTGSGPAPTVTRSDVADTASRTTVPATASPPAPGTTERTVDSGVPDVVPEGFDTTRAVVTMADGERCDVCLWLADTSQQRARGLMFVTDLGPAVGMAFRYPSPHTGTFWMQNTVLPLSIAFFAPDGSFVESFDMEPCTTDPCPRYSTPRDFLVAVEVPQGDLAEVGLVEGSRLELLDVPCDE